MLKTEQGLEIPCICVTNRRLCRGDFLDRLQRILESGQADAVVLREKDLTEDEYCLLAERVMRLCEGYSVPCILHSFYGAAMKLGCRQVHLPFDILEELCGCSSQGPDWKDAGKKQILFDVLGTSVHSAEQASQAVRLGVGYVIAGHVFDTDCKKGLPGRGLTFIREVSEAVPNGVRVFGIGGIHTGNAPDVINAGADGVCIMSGFMVESTTGLC